MCWTLMELSIGDRKFSWLVPQLWYGPSLHFDDPSSAWVSKRLMTGPFGHWFRRYEVKAAQFLYVL